MRTRERQHAPQLHIGFRGGFDELLLLELNKRSGKRILRRGLPANKENEKMDAMESMVLGSWLSGFQLLLASFRVGQIVRRKIFNICTYIKKTFFYVYVSCGFCGGKANL
jgi:hypothetical protein